MPLNLPEGFKNPGELLSYRQVKKQIRGEWKNKRHKLCESFYYDSNWKVLNWNFVRIIHENHEALTYQRIQVNALTGEVVVKCTYTNPKNMIED